MKLIDADVVIKGVQNRCLGATNVMVAENRIIDMLNRMPAVDAVSVRYGKWIDEGQYADFFPHHAWRCSECGEHVLEIDVPWFNYCPHCGARMGEECD